MKRLITLLLAVALTMRVSASIVIEVSATGGADNQVLADAIAKAASYGGKSVTIRLQKGTYNLDYNAAQKWVYHVSNTTSEQENATAMKHIALRLKGLKNLTIDGQGSTLLLDGEMTTFVVDSCSNITLRNLSVDNLHPTQIEMETTGEGADWMTVRVHPTSQYRITKDGLLEWWGKGWSFQNGIAQWYDRRSDMTWRGWSPTENLISATELRPNELYLRYREKPEVPVGTVFQVRDSYRDEVCALLLRSRDVRFENVNFWFLGNFGVVGQYSENITIDHCNFEPRPGSGRTNAGYADFLQLSGCKGLMKITHSRFTGAHDDPINIHGTHLRVMSQTAPDKLLVRFMHGQTYGFEAFSSGDEIQITDSNSLLPLAMAKVRKAEMISDYEMLLTLKAPLDSSVIAGKEVAVENVTWTPEVLISDCFFSRIPTRGILLTTRRHSVIERCTFVGMQMPSILVSNDARGWYESGPVADLTIRNNTFYRCGQPLIDINPENHIDEGPVHKNIVITHNTFGLDNASQPAVRAHSVEGLTIENNIIELSEPVTDAKSQLSQYFEISSSQAVTIEGNTINNNSPRLK